MMHDGDRWNQGFRSMHVHDAGLNEETISEGGRNNTHEVMNFCASWYPAALAAAAAAAVAVDDSSSPLASESESSTTARKPNPNPIGRSKSSRAGAGALFFARPFDDDFGTLGTLEEEEEEEGNEGRPSCAVGATSASGGGGGGRGGRGRDCRGDSEARATRNGGVGATMAADELADDNDDDDDDDDDARAVLAFFRLVVVVVVLLGPAGTSGVATRARGCVVVAATAADGGPALALVVALFLFV